MKSSAIILALLGLLAQSQADNVFIDRFIQQYNDIHNPDNYYFSEWGIPYHAVETLIVDGPDYGHETTSEAYSYWLWLEAMYGKVTRNFGPFNDAWTNMEKYMIPVHSSQNGSNYDPGKPATYSAELDLPSEYPSPMEYDVPVGSDPIYQELVSAYGSEDVYSMHWLLDVDNVYGFGNLPGACELGRRADGPSFIDTYQRGPQESVWKTIPHSTCDSFKFGGPNGFLDLFVGDNNYTQQWKYSNDPDADARAVQAAFWAHTWATENQQAGDVATAVEKAGKLGDYLRYALFDKYFKKIGNCVGPYNCPGGQGKESAHYLISRYFAWGAALWGGWSWRLGGGTVHFGHQNPLAAYALSNVTAMRPKSATGASDWQASLERQLEFYQYLQSVEGAFAGGATNTWNGRYDTPPDNLTNNTFHGMFYDWQPVYHDPASNRWYGMQPRSVDRLAQYYYVTGNATAKTLVEKWVNWIMSEIHFKDGTYKIPEWLEWSGVPPEVHVSVTRRSSDVGTASATARTLSFYAAKSGNDTVKEFARKLLDCIWLNYQTDKGVSNEEVFEDYNRFNEEVYVPDNWKGRYPNGRVIEPGVTFLSLRSFYKNDLKWRKVEAYLAGGEAPVFAYHRFWAQSDVALAQGTFGILFDV